VGASRPSTGTRGPEPGTLDARLDGVDVRARACHWVDFAGAHRDDNREPRNQGAPPTQPFVVQAGELVIKALETGQPERFIWIDEHGVTSKIGASAINRAKLRKHALWIPLDRLERAGSARNNSWRTYSS
jgi:hypothetical protein